MKDAAQVRMARKAALECDVKEGHRRVVQQFPRAFQLQIEHVMVGAGPSRCPKHTDEMDTAIAALVRESLQAQITPEAPHALDHPSQYVSRQTVCASIVGRSLSPAAEEEHPHGQGLRKVLRIQPFGCAALVRIGNEKGHELLRSRVLDVHLQTQLSVWATLEFGIQRAHQCGIESARYKIERGLGAYQGALASRDQRKRSGLFNVRGPVIHPMPYFKAERMLRTHREDVLVRRSPRSVTLRPPIRLDRNASSNRLP